MTRRGWLWTVLFASCAAAAISVQFERHESTPAEKALSDTNLSRAVTAAAGAAALKKVMRNPDSFKLSQVLIMADGTACYEYRAQNGFGGPSVENAVLFKGRIATENEDGFTKIWNQRCAHKQGSDQTDQVLLLMPG